MKLNAANLRSNIYALIFDILLMLQWPLILKIRNLEIENAFLVEACDRFRRPEFLDAPAWTNYGYFRIIIFED